jgi:hypothetical protein
MLPSLIGQLLESESDGGPDERSDDEELLQAAAVLNMALESAGLLPHP